MNHFTNFLFSSIILLVATLGNFSPVFAAPASPSAGSPEWMAAEKADPNLSSFINTVNTGQTGVITGIYVSGVMAYPVVQQPSNNAGFVSTEPNTLTQFKMASQFGTVGILAHNNLAGADFPKIKVGARIVLVYGDGSTIQYRVNDVNSYQALSPESPYSNFVALDQPDQEISATQLFYDIYGHEDQVVLQTCIENEGNASWGRLFITATPYTPATTILHSSIQKHYLPL